MTTLAGQQLSLIWEFLLLYSHTTIRECTVLINSYSSYFVYHQQYLHNNCVTQLTYFYTLSPPTLKLTIDRSDCYTLLQFKAVWLVQYTVDSTIVGTQRDATL